MKIRSWTRWDLGDIKNDLYRHPTITHDWRLECSDFAIHFDPVWEWLSFFDAPVGPLEVGGREKLGAYWQKRVDTAADFAQMALDHTVAEEFPRRYLGFCKEFVDRDVLGQGILLDTLRYLAATKLLRPIPKRLRFGGLVWGLARNLNLPQSFREVPARCAQVVHLPTEDVSTLNRFVLKHGSQSLFNQLVDTCTEMGH